MAEKSATLSMRVYGPLKQFVEHEQFKHRTTEGLAVRDLILELGIPQEHLVYTMCLINERRVKLSEPVAHGDQVDIFQPVAGG